MDYTKSITINIHVKLKTSIIEKSMWNVITAIRTPWNVCLAVFEQN